MSPDDPQRLQVPRRHDVLRAGDRGVAVDDREGRGIDDVDLAGDEIGRVDARQRARRRRAELARRGLGIDVPGIDERRHGQIGRRQVLEAGRAELVRRALDEILRRHADFDGAAAKRRALFAADAIGGNRQRSRARGERVGADKGADRDCGGAGRETRDHDPCCSGSTPPRRGRWFDERVSIADER